MEREKWFNNVMKGSLVRKILQFLDSGVLYPYCAAELSDASLCTNGRSRGGGR
jgi:hypothetical protein